jgi:hypothetical protein
VQSGGNANDKAEDLPRVYALHRSGLLRTWSCNLHANLYRNFFQMRIDRQRNAEIAKRNQQRIRDPTFFPAAPKGDVQ